MSSGDSCTKKPHWILHGLADEGKMKMKVSDKTVQVFFSFSLSWGTHHEFIKNIYIYMYIIYILNYFWRLFTGRSWGGLLCMLFAGRVTFNWSGSWARRGQDVRTGWERRTYIYIYMLPPVVPTFSPCWHIVGICYIYIYNVCNISLQIMHIPVKIQKG